jgi:Fur family ferric uptake transcriptional regulator
MARSTPQRQAIEAAFEQSRRPLSPREVQATAKKRSPGLGLATVYRHLKAMVDEGALMPVELPGEPPRYERHGLDHHHHFHCRKCGRVFDMDGCLHDIDTLAPRGFKVEAHEVVLYGLCAECSRL